jgi:AraC-like DNA-binding protein
MVAGLRGLHRLRRCLNGLGDLPAFVLRHDVRSGRIDWWELLRDDRRLRPYDFEFHFSVAGRRDDYHAANVAALRASGSARLSSLFGFSDLYVPLLIDQEFTLVFFCGQWATEVPPRAKITGVWRELSGHDPVFEDLLFRTWARCCLRVPVLDPALCHGLISIGQLLGRLFSGDAQRAERAIDRVREQVFRPFIHDDSWVESCLDTTGLTRPPWGLDEFMDVRLIEETQLRHRPSQLAVMVPNLAARAGGDELDVWIQQRQFQHHASLAAANMPDLMAASLGDQSVLVALAAPPALRGRAREAHFEAQCERLRLAIQERSGFTSTVGLGKEVAPGQGLGPCFRHAVAAVDAAVQKGDSPVRRRASSGGEEETAGQLSAIEARLKRAFEMGQAHRVPLEAVLYTREVTALTAARPQAMAVHFLLLMRDVLAMLESRNVLEAARTRSLYETALDDLSATPDPERLACKFEQILANLAELGSQPVGADRSERLRSAVEWLRGNLRVEEPLEVCARRAGLSTSSLRRAFRKQYGIAFSAWLRQERLDAARRLLVLSALRVEQVARDVGFRDAHTFIRRFRARFGRTPGAFRREGKLDGLR